MTLAEFHALQAMLDQDAEARDATARILALVPATAARLAITTESLWALEVKEAMRKLAATVPAVINADNAAELDAANTAAQEAFPAIREALEAELIEAMRERMA